MEEEGSRGGGDGAARRRGAGSMGCHGRKNKGKEERGEKIKEKARDLRNRVNGPKREVEGPLREKQKTEKGGCKMQGVGKEKARGRN